MLDAGGLDELADVAERRLRLSANSFGRAITSPFLPLASCHRRGDPQPSSGCSPGSARFRRCRAAFIGAVAATVVGTLANDSGALLLEIGTGYLLVFDRIRLGGGRVTSRRRASGATTVLYP